MRVAIPVKQDLGLDSQIDTSLSECTELLLVDVVDGNLQRSQVSVSDRPGDCACMVHDIATKHVDAVVFGRANLTQLDELQSAGIQAHVAGQGSVRQALCSILDGCLKDSDGKSLCLEADEQAGQG